MAWLVYAGGWWSKPSGAYPFLAPNSDGTYSVDIQTHPNDPFCPCIRVFVFREADTAEVPAMLGDAVLDEAYGRLGLANATVAQPPAAYMLGDQPFIVKLSREPVGPGGNIFSREAVSLVQGELILRIQQNATAPSGYASAEVYHLDSLGYGFYEFDVSADFDALDPIAVLGLFTWDDWGSAETLYNEIDFETSRWNNPSDVTNSQFVVQPFDVQGNLVRYTVPAEVTRAVFRFEWRADYIAFQSTNKATGAMIHSWTYTNAAYIQTPASERVHINLWQMGGAAPAGPQEVTIHSFKHYLNEEEPPSDRVGATASLLTAVLALLLLV